MVVTPPRIAARVSVSASSSKERSLPICVCGSKMPGRTSLPRASRMSSAASKIVANRGNLTARHADVRGKCPDIRHEQRTAADKQIEFFTLGHPTAPFQLQEIVGVEIVDRNFGFQIHVFRDEIGGLLHLASRS